jgi:hypothetical protein
MSSGSAEVYLTPVLAYVMYGDLTFSAGGIPLDHRRQPVDSSLSLGTNFRLGTALVKGLLTSDRVQATDLESGGSGERFQPSPSLGFGYRF